MLQAWAQWRPTHPTHDSFPNTQGEDGESLEARGLQLQEELARLRSKQDQSVGSLRTIRDNVRC